jgi:hypothetical protein
MRNILILTYWNYSDALIQTYTLPYLGMIRKNLPAGSTLYLVTLEKDQLSLQGPNYSVIKTRLKEDGIEWLPFRYHRFGALAFFYWIGIGVKLGLMILRKKIEVIHCWCTPAGAIGYVLATIFQRQLIIDSYEPHAEAMVENGTWNRRGIAFRLLFWLEKKQTNRADVLIATTEGMRGYAKEKYGVHVKQFYVKPACVDLDLFSEKDKKNSSLLARFGLKDKIVCVYAGKFGGIYLKQEVFDFFRQASIFWGDRFRVLLLTSHKREEINEFCQEAELSQEIVISTFVDHHDVPPYMGLGDFAITPVRPVPTKRFCSPIKDGEYWAMGLPIIIPANISDDSGIIERNGAGALLHSFSTQAYVESIEKIDTILQRPRPETIGKIRAIAVRFREFGIAAEVYNRVYGS